MTDWSYISSDERNDLMPYLYFISATMCIGIRTYKRMQGVFASPEEFYRESIDNLKAACIFTPAQINRIEEAKRIINPFEGYERVKILGVEMIPFDAKGYPYRLKEIKDPPPFLYLKGTLPTETLPTISVVGARECSAYGANVAKKLGERFGMLKVPVISGMARGVDSIAQRAALQSGGYSLALLGGGVDIVYPKESEDLYEMLLDKGGILSEFPPGTKPVKNYFALRNRLISGLSDAVCVVEAKEKSGTLITVDCALDQGREVYAVPGRITDITSMGTNELLKQGAGIITDVDCFVNEFVGNCYLPCEDEKGDGRLPNKAQILPDLTKDEMDVIMLSDDDSFTVDEMASFSGLPASAAILVCLSLTKKGILSGLGGGRFLLEEKGRLIKKSLTTIEE